MAKVKVVSEFYRIVGWLGERKTFATFDKPNWDAMYWKAIDTIREHGLASVTIERVTQWEMNIDELDVEDLLNLEIGEPDQNGMCRGEKVTGAYKISIPQHMPAELSRMDAVNGWMVPETIEI